MNIKLSQQVSATYARNHFKEVNEKALKEGFCVIMRKSSPLTIVMSMKEYGKLQNNLEVAKFTAAVKKKVAAKDLKNGRFSEFVGSWKNVYSGLTSVEIAKKWTDYVD